MRGLQKPFNPFPTPGDPSGRPSEPSMLAAAVGSAPGVARTRPMALRDRGSIRKVATSGPKVRFGHRRPSWLDGGSPLACRLQACPAGEPWHQFVRSGCHAGSAVLSYGRTPLESAIGWLRCLVRSFEPCILTVADSSGDRRRWKRRDRKVARAASHCMGSTTGMVRAAAMVDTTSDSPRWCRPTTPAAAFDVKKGVCLEAVSMMSVFVYARNRG